jgi:hypothetical protein
MRELGIGSYADSKGLPKRNIWKESLLSFGLRISLIHEYAKIG